MVDFASVIPMLKQTFPGTIRKDIVDAINISALEMSNIAIEIQQDISI